MKDNLDIHNVHDTYFKFIFQNIDHVKTFIEEFFPNIARHIQVQSIEINPTEKFLIDSNEKQYLDFALNCKIQHENTKIYIIIEHKFKPDKRVIIQLIKYILAVWQEDIASKRKLTGIIPMVFYNGKKPWRLPTSTLQIFDDYPQDIKNYFLNLQYLLFDINQINDVDIQKLLSRNMTLMVALDVMRGIKDCAIEDITKIIKELAYVIAQHRADYNEDLLMFMQMTIKYLQQSCKIKSEDIDRMVKTKEDKDMKTVFDLWKEQGMQQGMQQGIQQGMQQGMQQGIIKGAQDMVLAAIEARIESIPEELNKKIRSIEDSIYLQDLLKQIVKSTDVINTLNSQLTTVH